MSKRVNLSGMSLRGLVAGGLLAGAVGLGFGGGSYGTPSSTTPSASGTAIPSDDDLGEGGSKGPGMAAAEPAALPPNVAPGWKVRVCSEKTKASSIAFKVTSADDKAAGKNSKGEKKAADKTASGDPTVTDQTAPSAGMHETASWNQGDPSLINFPESVSRLEKIRIEAVPGQKDMRSEVCVLYNDHVAKKLTFDDKEIATVKMNESGACGC
jgi:hypothetical protein